MLVYKSGDILQATENIICHQVNVDGIMGGGLALQIASTYPECNLSYIDICSQFNNDYEKLKGKCLLHKSNDKQIANCFTQKPNFDTDYNSIKYCFSDLLNRCKECNYTIAVPFKYGCGIANGDWNIVNKIFENLSKEYGVDISVYRLEETKICQD